MRLLTDEKLWSLLGNRKNERKKGRLKTRSYWRIRSEIIKNLLGNGIIALKIIIKEPANVKLTFHSTVNQKQSSIILIPQSLRYPPHSFNVSIKAGRTWNSPFTNQLKWAAFTNLFLILRFILCEEYLKV